MESSGWRSVVRGVGAYLPERCVTNAELARTIDTTDEWIVQRTGITRRFFAAEGETTSQLATHAARAALARANREAGEVDLIIVATATPDYTFPATATQVQAALGVTAGVAFDLQAVFSRLLDWSDRTTCVLFGDGAGAVLLEAERGGDPRRDGGIITTHLRSDGRGREKLFVDGGPSTTGTTGHLRMEGKDVFRHAVGQVTDVVVDAFAAAGVGPDDLDWFVPHQANRRIIDASAAKLGIAPAKVVTTVHLHANTSAASVPLALDEACRDGRIRPGHLVMLEAVGGGFTWGSALLRW